MLLWLTVRCFAEAPPLVVVSGNLPLLIVAGHGGQLPLEGAEIRQKDKVADPHFVLFGDNHTNELATDLADALAQECGEGNRPSLILNQIHRRYADVNRTPQLTSHDPLGIEHHAAFHRSVATELERILASHGWALLLDVHGQATYPTSVLLGTAGNAVVAPWSLDTLWGQSGLVERLNEAAITVEPIAEDGAQRYAGGYTIRHHGEHPRVEAWQLEHSTTLREDLEIRSKYLELMAQHLAHRINSPPPSAEGSP